MENTLRFEKISDSQLYQLCQKYGGSARLWLRKFAGLLPEVFRRKLYKKHGYASIHEFAAKLAGMSLEAVDKVLRLSQRLADKPLLRAQLENGIHGWSKIEKVAFIATPVTDAMWAEKVNTLSKSALEVYVREMREKIAPGSESEHKAEIEQTWPHLSFPVSSQVQARLRLAKQRIEQERKQAITWNEVFVQLLKPTWKTEDAPRKIISICPECETRKANQAEALGVTTRHIPVNVSAVVREKYKGMCAYPSCNRVAEIFHHTRRFALRKNHDPKFIRPLCKAHERIAHAGLIENENSESSRMYMIKAPDPRDPRYFIDRKVLSYRHERSHPP